jgi:predicted nucleic-acid-binding protein
MRAVDANVLVRLLTSDDAKQTAAAEAFVANRAWVSHVVLAEALWVLQSVYDVDAEGRATAVEMLLSHETLTLEGPNVVASALAHFRRKPSLGFSDCLILEIARNAGHVPLGTFDRNLSRVDGAERL